jgi:hypothetical protein
MEAQRASVIPDAGELLFTTDNKQLFVGDGATAGGLLVGGGAATGYLQKIAGDAGDCVGRGFGCGHRPRAGVSAIAGAGDGAQGDRRGESVCECAQ